MNYQNAEITNPVPTSIVEPSPNPLEILKFIPAHAHIIVEIGCGTGIIGSQYKRINPHCRYIGIEPDSTLANAANSHLDIVVIDDPETVELTDLTLTEGSVDCLIYGTYLPRFKNPGETLRHHKTWLNEDAQILALIPNVQHWRQIVNLLRGEWPISTPSFPHAFTLETVKTLFSQAALQVYELQTRGQKSSDFFKFQELLEPMIQALGLDPHSFATQTNAEYYIVRAINSPVAPRRLLIQTAIMAPTGCDRLRVLEPDQFSATIPGVRTFSSVKSIASISPLPTEEKVFIWQRTIMTYPAYLTQLKSLLKQDYLIVAEIDDNPIRRREYAEHHYLSYRGCHCVQTSTEPLAEFLRQYNPNVAVFQNQLAYLPPRRTDTSAQTVTLFFGALNREKDWQPIMDRLNQVLKAYPQKVRVKVIHDQKFFNSVQTQNKDFEPFCSYERYQEILHTCDIGLLPLLSNPVNDMKSDLKFLECAGHGVVALASPTVYAQSITDGKTGMIYQSAKEFETKLKELINNTQLRHTIATHAYNWVRECRLLSQHYQQRRNWYLQMRDELPRLNAELQSRLPELFQE